MSFYQLNKLFFDLKRAEHRAAFQADKAAFVARYDLSPEERRAVDAEDFAELFRLGVNIYLLVTLMHLRHIPLPQLGAIMRGEGRTYPPGVSG